MLGYMKILSFKFLGYQHGLSACFAALLGRWCMTLCTQCHSITCQKTGVL